MDLYNCPFCDEAPSFSGDDCIFCECGVSVNAYGKNQIGDQDFVAAIWNNRSMNLTPQIIKSSKLPYLSSAYLDLCSADFKIKNKVETQ